VGHAEDLRDLGDTDSLRRHGAQEWHQTQLESPTRRVCGTAQAGRTAGPGERYLRPSPSSFLRSAENDPGRRYHRPVNDGISVLLLTGTIASGKTTIAAEIGEILLPARSIICIDLDQLGWAFIPDAPNDRILRLRTDNLTAIWANLHSAGFRHVVISAAISTANELRLIREAIDESRLTVVRLVASPALLEERLRRRDAGRRLEDHLETLPVLDRVMDGSNLEDFRVTNDQRSPRDVAMEVLETIGWA
jgi:adenylylsulfate kinase-like enzyme